MLPQNPWRAHVNFPCGAVVAALLPHCGTSHFVVIIPFLCAFFLHLVPMVRYIFGFRSGKQKAHFRERTVMLVSLLLLKLLISDYSFAPQYISLSHIFKVRRLDALSSSILSCYIHRAAVVLGMGARLAFRRPLLKVSPRA